MDVSPPEWIEDPARHAFWRVMAGVEDGRLDAEDLYPIWREHFASGEARPPIQLLTAIPETLEWPLLEVWSDRFGQERPNLWTSRRPHFVSLPQQVLLHTLMTSAQFMIRLARVLESHHSHGLAVGRPLPAGFSWRITTPPPEPALVMQICTEGADRLRSGDWSALPPFFPGDRTGANIHIDLRALKGRPASN